MRYRTCSPREGKFEHVPAVSPAALQTIVEVHVSDVVELVAQILCYI